MTDLLLPFAAAVVVLVITLMVWRSAEMRAPGKCPRRRLAEDLAAHFDYRVENADRRQFIGGCMAGLWFADSKPGGAAIRSTYELTMKRLRAAENDDWHYDLGWALAVRPAWLRHGGQRHSRVMDPRLQMRTKP